MPIVLNPPGIVIPGNANPVDLATLTYTVNVLAAGGMTPNAAQSLIVPNLITAASREMIRFMGRRLDLRTCNEILTPEGTRQDRGEPASAKLSNFPIVDVTRVDTCRSTVLSISNADTATNQRATVAFAVTGDLEYSDLEYVGLNLTRTASGTPSTASLLFAAYPTIDALATAINALGNGWKATVGAGTPSPGLFPAADLVGVREPKNALGTGACLDLFTQAASSYDINRSTGIMRCFGLDGWGGGYGGDWAFQGDGSGGYGGGYGWGQYRVTYTAGFAVIPEAVAQVCAEVVKGMLSRLGMDPNLQSETTGKYTYTARQIIPTLPDWARQTLMLYKDSFI